MQSFSIILSKDRSSRYFNLVGIFCLIGNGVIFAQILLDIPDVWGKIIGSMGIAVCVLTFILRARLKNKFIPHSLIPVFSFFLLGVLLLYAGIFYPGLCDILLSAAVFFAGKPKKIIFTDGGIQLPFLFAECTGWEKFSNVIMKDQVLTLDFRNNKLIQLVIDPELNPLLIENQFNQFCQSRLRAASQAD